MAKKEKPVRKIQVRRYQLRQIELLGNAAFADKGNSFAGGIRYTPSMLLTPNYGLKGIIGLQGMKGVQKQYFIAEYGIAFQLNPLRTFTVNLGGKGLTSILLDDQVTRPAADVGLEYKLKKPWFGFVDKLVADAAYVFNSENMVLITYGTRISF